MRKIRKSLPIIISICLVLSLFVSTKTVSAATNSSSIQHVHDDAGLFSSGEISDLEAKCTSYGNKAGIQIMILTHDNQAAPGAEKYIEDFEDQLPSGDRVYLLIDMHSRTVFIEGYGTAETYINSTRIDKIINKITPDLTSADYYDACISYIKQSAAYMNDHSSDNPVINALSKVWVQLLIAVVIGVIAVAVMAYNSGGRMTVSGSNYIDQNNSGLIGRRDDYIRTTVTRIRKPQNNSSGFRGGVSAGGRSHSSGGGRF